MSYFASLTNWFSTWRWIQMQFIYSSVIILCVVGYISLMCRNLGWDNYHDCNIWHVCKYTVFVFTGLCSDLVLILYNFYFIFSQGSLERSTLVQEEGSESLMQLSISRTSPSVNHTITIETDAVHCQRSENVVAFEETVVSENSSLQVIEEATPLLSHHENDQAATQSVHVGSHA